MPVYGSWVIHIRKTSDIHVIGDTENLTIGIKKRSNVMNHPVLWQSAVASGSPVEASVQLPVVPLLGIRPKRKITTG